jgi:DNA polymerase
VGGWEYSVHPSTEILCAAWQVGTRETLKDAPVLWWAPGLEGGQLADLIASISNPDITLVAHNAYFEQVITRNVFAARYMYSMKEKLKAPPERWICTASLAAALALPRKLEGAGAALRLPVQKDMDGNRLVLKWCKPKKPSKKDPSTRHTDQTELKRLVEYCRTDVKVETELFLRCPPLTDKERRVWLLDQRTNLRGVLADRDLVSKSLAMIETETTRLNRLVAKTTGLKSATQRDALLKWLEGEGVFLPNAQRKTIEDAISGGMAEGKALEMLNARLAISKTSTAKFVAFEGRSRHDGRVRDTLVYHAAATGRWGGSGVQLQNLPRPSLKDTNQAAEIVKEGCLETVRLLYGNPMEVFSSILRGVLVAPPGYILDVADYASIEARVLFWLADHADGVKAFKDGRDLYREMAAYVYAKPLASIEKDSFERFLGKSAILGCGYGLGFKKFVDMVFLLSNKRITEEMAKRAVDGYRAKHAPVTKLWGNLERAAKAAIESPGKTFKINKTAWYVGRVGGIPFLFCRLPSGRRIAYCEPKIESVKTSWGEPRLAMTYSCVNGKTKKWGRESTYGGALTENVVQAIARDFMAEAMLRADDDGRWQLALSVHDELVAERDVFSGATNKEFCDLMAELPDWAEGCPIAVEGFETERYRK